MVARLGNRVPLMANMVEGGATPALDAAALQALGFRQMRAAIVRVVENIDVPIGQIAVAMKAGASDFMMKPFDRDLLEAKFLPQQEEELAQAG